MKTLFISAGPITWGSSRFRCFWVAEHMEDARVIHWEDWERLVNTGEQIPAADNYIFQKNIRPDIAQQMRGVGKKVYWDVCDPSWWWEAEECLKAAESVDGIVASNTGLYNDVVNFFPAGQNNIYMIPDRMNLTHYNKQRVHQDADPVRFIWYGASMNRFAMLGAYTGLTRLAANGYNVELTMMDDRPNDPYRMGNEIPFYQVGFDLKREAEIISNHDIAILPPYPGPWGDVKSNNRSLTAWACGLPVTTGFDYEEIVYLVKTFQERRLRAKYGLLEVQEKWEVSQSAKDWDKVLAGEFSSDYGLPSEYSDDI